ncbi:flavin-dependent oxidoreductase [Actibacterium sp. 188UL27-1]|uniref:flavin-dependent oxidoreductase n=1 Tax=Actibacterium sp. 188UL27-1 TaxID=2786961 RepID=UPI001958508F|nr:flavin-dependent oxidoreductase [Actibacterium sp. 188UL27-1]MBM7067353.1 flavin-dependent oxidoreductase [Actibacterium sp. 188UL27-1]
MTVLIAGAGIGGLSLGLSLYQLGIPFRIFEAVETLKPLGVGINLQPQAVRELFTLGLEDGLDGIGLRTEEVAYFSVHGQPIWSEPRGQSAGYTWPQFSLHRGKLQMLLHDTLVARAGPVVTTGAAVTGWVEDGQGVRITLTNRGTGKDLGQEEGAVLIACDGINSILRALLYPDEGPAKWGGTMMWRGTTRGPRFLTGRSVAMTGEKDRKFVCYPIADDSEGSVLNWIADLTMPPDYDWRKQDWNCDGALDDVLPHFADWSFDWLDIPAVMRAADGIWEYPMVDRDPLPQWTHGPVTLLGDAAHAMYPIGSNGASQGILDARILARALKEYGQTRDALQSYESQRREAVNAVVVANRGDGPDKILDIVADRAPNGFSDIEDIMPLAERQALADHYKSVAGMTIAAVNDTAPILK